MKNKIKLIAVISAMVMALALVLAGCQQPSSGDGGNSSGAGSSGETVPEGFVKVTGGTVTGKSNTNNYDGVFKKGRTVTLSDFFMSNCEVTQAEYSAVMTGQKVKVGETEYTLNANPSYCTEANKSEYGVNFGTEQGKRPVEGVT